MEGARDVRETGDIVRGLTEQREGIRRKGLRQLLRHLDSRNSAHGKFYKGTIGRVQLPCSGKHDLNPNVACNFK